MADQLSPDSPKVNPLEYFSRTEWYGNATTPAIRWIAEADQDALDVAVAEAKAEGDVSRANVARKLGWTSPETRRYRRNLTAEERGHAAVTRLRERVGADERDAWTRGALGALSDFDG